MYQEAYKIKRFKRIFLLLILLSYTSIFAKVSIVLKDLNIIPQKDRFLVTGRVIASGLNTPIPEKDWVDIKAEFKTSPNAKYPKLAEYYNIAKGCRAIANKCLSKEEEEGRGIKSIGLVGIMLRKVPVWLAYGGLGKWEKNAPDRVQKSFKGYIPLKYEGKRVRIRAILTHVIGGPYASWPGISYYNDTKEVYLPHIRSNNNQIKINSSKSIHPKRNINNSINSQIEKIKNDLNVCQKYVQAIEKHLNYLKKKKEEADNAILFPSTGTHQAIIDDIQTLRQLNKAGANYGVVLDILDPMRRSVRLAEWIRIEQSALNEKKSICNRLEDNLNRLQRRRKFQERLNSAERK